jgi:myo-inositol-1(or 4)-monophosphatase
MEEYLNFAKELAAEAGEIMLKYFKPGVQHHFKADKTIVTIADEEINQLVIDRVGVKYPEHSVLGEEASNDTKSNLAWICDPIDGTRPYSLGIPVSTFSLAFAEEGVPLVGVIYDPFTKSMYYAVKGEGAYMNDTPIKVSQKKLGERTITHIDSWSSANVDVLGIASRLLAETSTYILSIGSVVRASSLVSIGNFEAAIFPGRKGKFVDIAAAKIIVEEAGGKVTSLSGEEQRYDQDINGAIISNGVCHDQVVAAVKEVL